MKRGNPFANILSELGIKGDNMTITKFTQKYNLPKYRLMQFNKAFHQEAIVSFDDLTTWPKDLREKLKEEVEFSSLEKLDEVKSKNGKTTKVLFETRDKELRIESVLMRYKDNRNSVCVSCMQGCPVGCSFCATGRMGFGGNLSGIEIVDQVMYFQRKLKKEGEKVTNVTFMGMGEPMLNIVSVREAIEILTDPEKLGLSQRRITVSTVGFVPQLRRFLEGGFRGRLAISLHAPTQKLREQIMSVAKKNHLDDLFEVLDKWTSIVNKRVTYEYILIKRVNDRPKHAFALVELLEDRLAHVNLIPYNPIQGANFKTSNREDVNNFFNILDKRGISVTTRRTMGADVGAACGQLIVNGK